MAYGPYFADAFRHLGTYVDKILEGARPGDLPVEQATRFERHQSQDRPPAGPHRAGLAAAEGRRRDRVSPPRAGEPSWSSGIASAGTP
jgi:hypothetical protein